MKRTEKQNAIRKELELRSKKIIGLAEEDLAQIAGGGIIVGEAPAVKRLIPIGPIYRLASAGTDGGSWGPHWGERTGTDGGSWGPHWGE